MRQSTRAEEGFGKYRGPTCREKFLNEMNPDRIEPETPVENTCFV